MSKRVVLVVGAAGDVGQGVVEAALAAGLQVVAAGRSAEKLQRIAARHPNAALACITGDLGSESAAARLWDDAVAAFGCIDHVVVSVNTPAKPLPLMQWSAADLGAQLSGDVMVHFIAAKVFLPRLPESGLFIGIGGGTADFIIPTLAYISMAQAAQRMLYRGLARERRAGAGIRELMVVSMVNGESNRDKAKPEWVTDVDIGRHVCAILDKPEAFPQPVLLLKSREQVGLPEAVG